MFRELLLPATFIHLDQKCDSGWRALKHDPGGAIGPRNRSENDDRGGGG